jgi:PQQ-like domain
MLHESAARAAEVLCLNVEDLYPQDKRGKITAAGGVTEWMHWQCGTAQLLPRLIGRRTRGPLFLTDRRAPAGTPTLDVCPKTGRARLSCRRCGAARCAHTPRPHGSAPRARPGVESLGHVADPGVLEMGRIAKRRLLQVRPVWQVPGATGPSGSQDAVGAWYEAGVVVRGQAEGLHGYDAGTGEARWSWIAPGRRSLLAMSRTAVRGVGLAVHADDSAPGGRAADCAVTAVSAETGTALWSAPYAFSDMSWRWENEICGAIAVAPDRAVVLADGSPRAHALHSGDSVWPPVAPLKGKSRLAVCRRGIVQTGLDGGRLTVRCLDASEGSVRWEVGPSLDGPVAEVHVLHGDPPAVLCLGEGRRALAMVVILGADDGRTTALIPLHGPHGELCVNEHEYGLADDQPVVAVRDLLVAKVDPVGAYDDRLTAFALDGGAPRWTWRAQRTIFGVLASGGDIVVMSKHVAPAGELDGPAHVHLLDGATGTVLAVRRLHGYQAGMRGRYHMDEHHRLLRVSHWGGNNWKPLQMFHLRRSGPTRQERHRPAQG